MQQRQQTKHIQVMNYAEGLVNCPNSRCLLRGPGQRRSYCTFDVVHNWDYVLSEQLRGAATELCWLNVLENGTKLRIFLIEQISGQEAIFWQGGAERVEAVRSID